MRYFIVKYHTAIKKQSYKIKYVIFNEGIFPLRLGNDK